jgi:hypothetical protein
VFKLLMACCFNQRPYQSRYDYGDYSNNSASNDELLLLRNQMPSTSTTSNGRPPMASPLAPPNNSFSNGEAAAASRPFFSPGSQVGTPGVGRTSTNNGAETPASSASSRERHIYDESIYNSPSIIKPSMTGDGVRRRNPYT